MTEPPHTPTPPEDVPAQPNARRWADRVVAVYGKRAGLDGAPLARLAAEIGEALEAAESVGIPTGEWPRHVNLALDDWERRAGLKGPRFATFHPTGAVVLARRAP